MITIKRAVAKRIDGLRVDSRYNNTLGAILIIDIHFALFHLIAGSTKRDTRFINKGTETCTLTNFTNNVCVIH